MDEFDDELIDFEESLDSSINEEITTTQDTQSDDFFDDESPLQQEDDDSFISELLKDRGIDDLSKIKFENEDGEIEEAHWDSLSNEDKLNILRSSETSAEDGLDDSEIQLINAIRQSQLTPQEYLQYLQQTGIETYLRNVQNQERHYSIDEYTDEELYVMDLINRTPDITEEEAIEALERAKSNEALFKKQIGATRNEYKKVEDENIYQQQLAQQQAAQQQYNQFAESIENSIINFKEFSGCELNMDSDDMQELYTFITGTDGAGNNWFAKALNDPDTVVKMAWFALNGEKMIQDINEYYQKEITNVRKQSYQKGLESKDKSQVVYKPKNNNRSKSKKDNYFDDLDDF